MLSSFNARHAPGSQAAATLSSRDRVVIWSCMIGVTALAWLYLARLDHAMPIAADMNMAMAAQWTAAELWFLFAMWAVMMVGMMAPAAMPTLLLFAGAHARKRARSVPRIVLVFASGYAGVWLCFSAAAALVQWTLHNAALLSPQMSAAGPMLGGAILCAAGVYQLLPLKAACLVRCRSPLGFLMTHWRDGKLGAFRMGLRHGGWCLGCCWALMTVLFVVGVMNLAWVAALALFVLLEKTGPAHAVTSRIGGAVLIGAGILLLARS